MRASRSFRENDAAPFQNEPGRASRDRMAAAGRARYDEGSYGHRQQR